MAWPHQVSIQVPQGDRWLVASGIGQGFSCRSPSHPPAKIAVIVSGPAPFFSSPVQGMEAGKDLVILQTQTKPQKKQLTKDWDGHAHLECPKIRHLVL